MSKIDQLADRVCPECGGDGKYRTDPSDDSFDLTHETCTTCKGTGKEFWQLWRRCVPAYRVSGGWELVPEAERTSILLDLALDALDSFTIGKTLGLGKEPKGKYYAWEVWQPEIYDSIGEALAQVIIMVKEEENVC